MLLELVGGEVGCHESYDVADDGSEISPSKALARKEIDNGADEGEVPVVPQVDVHGSCGLGQKHQEVNA